ncbi:MAG: hypothetical protein ACOCVR_04760, partial [Myxococcota bacterium]
MVRQVRSELLVPVILAAFVLMLSCAQRAHRPDEEPDTAQPPEEATEPEAAAEPEVDLDAIAERLQADLQARGYRVARGSATLFTIDDCRYAIEAAGNCYGNNPTAPYVLLAVPLWEDEFVDEAMDDAFGPTPGDTWNTFRLDENEALVVLARMPPNGRYYGIQTYAYSRQGEIDTNDPAYQALADEQQLREILFSAAPNPDRVIAFAPVGNSVNNAVVEQETGAAFDESRYLTITPDAALGREMADALMRAGVPDRSHVFEEPVSPE